MQQGKSETELKGYISVRTSGSQRPLFLMHDYSGMGLYFKLLAKHLDSDIPIYGLPGMPLDEPQLRTIEAMAARIVRIIRTVQPDGPYRIAGWSLGGIVAYEVATQFIGQDQIVEFLGLVDSVSPAIWTGNKGEVRRATSPEGRLLKIFNDETLSAKQRIALEELKRTADGVGVEELLNDCRKSGFPDILQGFTHTEIEQFIARLTAHAHAFENYAVRQNSVAMHLFAAEEKPSDQQNQIIHDPLLGWGLVLPENQIQLIHVPGSDQSLMNDPQIAILGESLSRALTQAGGSQKTGLPKALHHSQVTIQTGKRGSVPIFCLPGAGNSVASFFDLANALGGDWPLQGLQPRGTDDLSIPHSTVEAAAAAYLREMNAAYPEGPVHLLGHSFGGWVALELAHQMCVIDRTVASLTIIDSDVPNGNCMNVGEYTSFEVLSELIQIIELNAEASLGINSTELAYVDETQQLEMLHEGMVRVGLMDRRIRPEAMRGVLRTFGAALRTIYRPRQTFQGPLRLVLIADALIDEQANGRQHHKVLEGWRQWAPNVTYWHGPGNHMTILKPPHVNALANWWLDGLAPSSKELMRVSR